MSLARLVGGVFAGLMIVGSGALYGQNYPNKTIRIFTNAPGGSGDVQSRAIGEKISAALGQPVVVDNRGSVVPMMVSTTSAAPDGYSIGVTGASAWTLPLTEKTAWDFNNVTAITISTREILVLTVHPSVPVKSTKELIALAKAKPGVLNFAGSGVMGKSTMGMNLFKSMAGVNMVHVNYVGTSQMMTGVVSGEVPVVLAEVNWVAPQQKAGRLRALAVSTTNASEMAPGLPPIADTLPGFEWVGMTAVLIPAKTPEPIVTLLNREVVRALNASDVKQQFSARGFEIVANSPDQANAAIKKESANTLKIVKDMKDKAS